MVKLSLGLVAVLLVVCSMLGGSDARRHHRRRKSIRSISRLFVSHSVFLAGFPEASDGYVDLDEFLRYYCRGAKGNYERCQRCIAVACVRELDSKIAHKPMRHT